MHHHVMGSSLPNAFTNGGPSQDPRMHAAVEMSAHAARMSTLPNMLSAQGANMGLMPGLNSQIIRSETDYVGTPSYIFGTDGNVMEASPSIADASVASLSSMASNSHPMPEPLDAENNYGYLSQIPRNFSFTDLTADFAKSSDILDNYPRSPFLATDDESFLDSCEREHQGNGRRLDTVSEGMSYDEFGSE
uniref:Uncharacterized protein n=2 Tax=Rhizophora mucronata TaxID=61149 RepID=A0A2P2KHR5_RHIMU